MGSDGRQLGVGTMYELSWVCLFFGVLDYKLSLQARLYGRYGGHIL